MFQLDPKSIAVRTRYAASPRVPGFFESLARGTIGFTVVSVAGFAPWALGESWLFHRVGETGLYACCALVFIVLSGALLHKLIIGPETLLRFYQVFSPAFTFYAIAWIAGWMLLRGDKGGLVGLAAGALLFSAILAHAFVAHRVTLFIAIVLLVTNAAGYFGGGWVESAIGSAHMTVAMLAWGVCYGLGFGAGLGFAFYTCQAEVRRLLNEPALSANLTP